MSGLTYERSTAVLLDFLAGFRVFLLYEIDLLCYNGAREEHKEYIA